MVRGTHPTRLELTFLAVVGCAVRTTDGTEHREPQRIIEGVSRFSFFGPAWITFPNLP
jgi:hypothetical protein